MNKNDVIAWAQVINTFAYIVTILVGVGGNLWVSWKVGIVFLFGKTSPVPRNIIILILLICIADIMVLIHLILYVHFRLHQQWIFGFAICKSFYCIEVINKLFIPLALVQISRESYESVRMTSHKCAKGNSNKWIALFYAYSVLAFLAVIALIISVLIFADTRTYDIPRRGVLTQVTVCSFHPPSPYDMAFNILAFVFGYIFTSAAYVYFYLRVPMILKRRYSSIKNASSCKNRLNCGSILRIRRTVTAFVIVYLTCWTPYWVLFWVLFFFPIVSSWMVVASTFTHLLPYISCTAYPVILTAINKRIRSAHTTIVSNQKKKLNTIREGAFQMIQTQLGFVQTWLHDETQSNFFQPRWSTTLNGGLSKGEEIEETTTRTI